MRFALSLVFSLFCINCWSQQDEQKEVGKTIERFLYVLSFPDSSSMQIDSLPALFTSDGKLVANSGKKPFIYTVPQYVESIRSSVRSGQLYSSRERELARKVDVFGNIAHVLSTYELTMVGKEGAIVRRGLNSIQLLKQDGKWLICSLIWDRERNELKLPAKYLPEGQ
ncbi:MAG TPA: nuclear transport factor 2 family protein [Flavisolibacter sp.]|jgi:hypothetical protein|nr:nuclear transport factor 2 family protein [Flavisolibacter sp.]